MTNAPTPAGGRQFSGKAVLAVVGLISLIMCTLVIVLVRKDVTRAMDERSDEAAVFEAVAHAEELVQPVADDEPGWWRCEMPVPLDDSIDMFATQGAITFAMWLPPKGDSRPAYIRNGDELIEVEASWDGTNLEIPFRYFDSKITAMLTDEDRLEGVWWKVRPGEVASMDFIAQRVGRFDDCYPAVSAEYPAAVASDKLEWSDPQTFRMIFDKSGAAKGVFQSAKAGPIRYGKPTEGEDGLYRWKGTILTPTGDYRYLYGSYEMDSGTMMGYLSVFDGAHAFLFDFRKSTSPEIVAEGQRGAIGWFHSGNSWSESFDFVFLDPGAEYTLPDPFSQVGLKPGETRLHLPLLDEPKYAGKPMIVEIMGTWCPNCHDANRLLVELYHKHHDEGLEILDLAYEHTDDEARSLRQIERFKQRIGVTWEIVPAGVSDKKKTAATLPALTDIKSYPTTIFLNRDHTVEAIHSGFSGPATGEAYTKTRAEFERLIKKILDSK